MSPVCRTLKNVGSPRMIVDVPEIYGCMADGASPVEALENVETIIDEWFETVRAIWCEIPETKGRLLYA